MLVTLVKTVDGKDKTHGVWSLLSSFPRCKAGGKLNRSAVLPKAGMTSIDCDFSYLLQSTSYTACGINILCLCSMVGTSTLALLLLATPTHTWPIMVRDACTCILGRIEAAIVWRTTDETATQHTEAPRGSPNDNVAIPAYRIGTM